MERFKGYIPGWKDFRKMDSDELLVEYIKMFPKKIDEITRVGRGKDATKGYDPYDHGIIT